jgi:hypothetical protein
MKVIFGGGGAEELTMKVAGEVRVSPPLVPLMRIE